MTKIVFKIVPWPFHLNSSTHRYSFIIILYIKSSLCLLISNVQQICQYFHANVTVFYPNYSASIFHTVSIFLITLYSHLHFIYICERFCVFWRHANKEYMTVDDLITFLESEQGVNYSAQISKRKQTIIVIKTFFLKEPSSLLTRLLSNFQLSNVSREHAIALIEQFEPSPGSRSNCHLHIEGADSIIHHRKNNLPCWLIALFYFFQSLTGWV